MNKHYPEALVIEPMKINRIPDGKEHMFPSLCESGDYFAQIKKDGYWYQFERTENYCYLFSRNKTVQGVLAEKGANVPHIMSTLKILPPGTILVGEIYYPGKRSKDVTPIMGSLPEKAIERQEKEYGYLHYYLHDILYYKGRDLTNEGASVRYEILKRIYDRYLLSAYTMNDGESFIELAERVDENIQEFVADALERGEEGAVLKKKTAPYTPGKRPAWDTIKIKKTDTCDAVCMGFCEPTKEYTGKEIETWPYWITTFDGKSWFRLKEECKYKQYKGAPHLYMPVTQAYYYGWVTSMRVGAYDDEGELREIGTVSSGMTHELQESASKDPTKYYGKVVKLAGMEKDREAKTLRHFYFKGFHEDKNPCDCLLSEIF